MPRRIRYVMRVDSPIHPPAVAGSRIYPSGRSDWGLARDAERATGKAYLTMTLDPTGQGYGFVVDCDDMIVVEDSDA